MRPCLEAEFREGFREMGREDLIGDKEIAGHAYYGVQTARAQENFHITGVTLSNFSTFITSLAEHRYHSAPNLPPTEW